MAKVIQAGNLRRLRRSAQLTGMTPATITREGMDITLTKGERLRRYWIRPGRAHDEWYCQVWFSEQLQHRGDAVLGLISMHRLKGQYLREIRELEIDGWLRRA